MNKYSLIPHLDQLYSVNFKKKPAPSQKNFVIWQRKKRKELATLLGLPKLTLKKVIKKNSRKKGGIIITRFDFYLSDRTVMPVYFAHDEKIKPPFHPIIVNHGHSDGASTLFGDRMTKEGQDYGLEFVRGGYLVIAPDHRGFAG